MKVVADRNAADSQPLDEIVVNKVLRRGLSAGLVEGHHHRPRQSGRGQKAKFSGLVGKAELRGVWAEITPRVRFEGHRENRLAVREPHAQGSVNHGAVAEVNAIEIA